jgi:ribosomal protein S18 acetylase RimI-like enzyme
MSIRTIGGDEWRLWRSLRLRAVEESPDAFRGTLEQESAEAAEQWRELIGQTARHPGNLMLVAEVEADPAGMLFARLDEARELMDIGSMWVDPEVRRRGIGCNMIRSALEWARAAGASRAELWVTLGNDGAERFYEAAGFEATSETEPLREGSDLNVVKMAVRL